MTMGRPQGLHIIQPQATRDVVASPQATVPSTASVAVSQAAGPGLVLQNQLGQPVLQVWEGTVRGTCLLSTQQITGGSGVGNYKVYD